MPTKRNLERRIGDLETEDGTDSDSGLLIGYHDEETGTYYDYDGDPLDTENARLMIVVPTDGPPESAPFCGKGA